MQMLRQWMGSVIDLIKGPSKTSIHYGKAEDARTLLRPNNLTFDVQVGIECRRIVYLTEYKRWWIADQQMTMYEVQGHAPNHIAEGMDERLFERITYPLLCNKFLEWTPFPHYYAIRAYLARLD
jgi:hypothetical protein